MDSYLLFQSQTHKWQCCRPWFSNSKILPLRFRLLKKLHCHICSPFGAVQLSVILCLNIQYLSSNSQWWRGEMSTIVCFPTRPDFWRPFHKNCHAHTYKRIRGSFLLFFFSIPPFSFPFPLPPSFPPSPWSTSIETASLQNANTPKPQQPMAHQQGQIMANHLPQSFLRHEGWLRELGGVGMGKCRGFYEEKKRAERENDRLDMLLVLQHLHNNSCCPNINAIAGC